MMVESPTAAPALSNGATPAAIVRTIPMAPASSATMNEMSPRVRPLGSFFSEVALYFFHRCGLSSLEVAGAGEVCSK